MQSIWSNNKWLSHAVEVKSKGRLIKRVRYNGEQKLTLNNKWIKNSYLISVKKIINPFSTLN